MRSSLTDCWRLQRQPQGGALRAFRQRSIHTGRIRTYTERSTSNDWVARYESRWFQLERSSDYPPRQVKVTFCEGEDERIEIRYEGKARRHHEIAPPKPAAIDLREKPPRRSHRKPPADHPGKTAMPRAPASTPL